MNLKVLIIDDQTTKIEAVKEAIHGAGIPGVEIDEAKSVNSACSKCHSTAYDLIVLDVNIPIKDDGQPKSDGGITFLKNTRTQRRLKAPKKLIGLTAYADIASQYLNEFESDCYTLIQYESNSDDWKSQIRAVLAQLDQTIDSTVEENRSQLFDRFLILASLIIACVACFSPINLFGYKLTILFFICSLMPAVAFGRQATSKLNWKIPGMIFSTSGAGAVFIGVLMLLNYISSPKLTLGVYEIVDKAGRNVELSDSDIIAQAGSGGSTPSIFLNGSTMIVIFPKDQTKAKIRFSSNSEYKIISWNPGKVQTLEF